MLRHIVISLLSCAALILPAAAQADALRVRLVMSDSSLPYQQFAASFSKALAASHADVFVTESQSVSGSDIDLIVTVGMKASELAAAQTSAPVLAVMIPKAGFEELLSQAASQKISPSISAIYLDQPWGRQLDFLRAALPERRRIGLLHSLDTRIDVARLRQDIARRGGTLSAQPVRSAERLFSGLDRVLDDIDVLLAIPDSMIYSSGNIRNILLTSYRHSVPLVGLSQSYVNAGALCAIFSTPEQLADQAGSAVSLFARSRRLPDSQYPAAFTIAVNQQVARSLGIALTSPEAIRSQMDKAKEK